MSSPASLETAEAELLNVGNGIRQLKLELKEATDDETKAKLQSEILDRVNHLNDLKEQHCEVLLAEIHRLNELSNSHDDDGRSERIESLVNLLPSNVAKDLRKKRKKNVKKQKTAKERQFDVHKGVEDVKCQRKIHNLLANEGEGDTFRYFLRINPTVEFAEGDHVYLTEKIDGTTMQATKNGVYKRFERTGARESGKWHGLSGDERYSLERVDLDNRSNKYISKAVSPYLHLFDKLPDGVCIYFEAIGPRIGSRFTDVELSNTIQVFDSSHNGDEFASFEKTVELCSDLGLPIVAHSVTDLSLAGILDTLSKKPDYSEFRAPLEGLVVRPAAAGGSAAAKIRVDDLPNVVVDDDDDNETSK